MAFSCQRYSFDHQWINEEILMITATSTYKRRKIDHRIWIKILWRMISYLANDTMIDIKICDKHKTFFSSFINITFRLLFGSCKQSTFLKIILILQNSILYYYEFYLLGLTNRTISFIHACSSHGISDISTKSLIIGTAHKLLITISQ